MIRIALTRHWGQLCSVCVTGLILLLSPTAYGARYALLVGNSSAGAADAALKYVDNDISAMNRTLSQICGFDRKNITTLYNATPADLDQSIDAICARLKQGADDDLFLFYYTGHADDKNLKMGSVPYSFAMLRERFKNIPAQIRIGVFDACQSGSFTRLKGGNLAEPFLFPGDTKIAGQVILSSSSSNESSQESDGYRSSVFTFHFVNGLRGGADASGDRRVTLSEAYQYAYNRTVTSTARSSGGVQHPGYQFSIQGEGEIVLADLTTRTSGVILSKGIAGDITITEHEGASPVDLVKEGPATIMVALSPGEYQVTCRSGDDIRRAAVTISDGHPEVLEISDLPLVKTAPSRLKGVDTTEYRTRFSILATGSYRFMRLQCLSDDLTAQFADYSLFNLNPTFPMPRGMAFYGGGYELWIRELVPVSLTVAYASMQNSASYTSERINPFDTKTYTAGFSYENRVQVWSVQLGSGFRIRSGILKNLALHAGFDINAVQLNITTRFNDALYNVEENRNVQVDGKTILPFIAASYRYPLGNMVDLGLRAGYRYEHQPAALSNTLTYGRSDIALRYDLGGFDASAFITFTPGRN